MLLLFLLLTVNLFVLSNCVSVQKLKFRGGLVPQATEPEFPGDDEDHIDYFEKFDLDYDLEDNFRVAGSTKGFIKANSLLRLKPKDPLQKWFVEYLENGKDTASNDRIKPFFVSYKSTITRRSCHPWLYTAFCSLGCWLWNKEATWRPKSRKSYSTL